MWRSSAGVWAVVSLIVGLAGPAILAEADAPRIALVVGNGAYAGDAALKNPVNDATDVAAALTQVGWSVTLVTDADRRGFNRAIAAFRDALSATEGSDALFYYAGHGMQVDGVNFLIPVNSDFETIDDVKSDAISMQSVTDAIQQAQAGVSLIILDACRDNPFAKKMTRSLGGTRGLTVVSGAAGKRGSAIMFSTSPGDVAMDGSGRNGLFTSCLLKYVSSDLKIEELFKHVTADVRDASGGSQKPWINASLAGDFYFVSDAIRAAQTQAAAKAAADAKAAELARAAETARAEEAAKTEQARLEAEAAKKVAADALAAQTKAEADARAAAELVKAQQNLPRGKLRVESGVNGRVYAGPDLLGEVGPDTPLVADSLPLGSLEVRFEADGAPTERKSVTVNDKAYVTVVFAKTAITGVSATQDKPAAGTGPATLWIRKAGGQNEPVSMSIVADGMPDSSARTFTDKDPFPISVEPGVYKISARISEDSEATYLKTFQLLPGGSVVVELPALKLSANFVRTKQLKELTASLTVLEKKTAVSKFNRDFMHGTGWIILGTGVVGLAVDCYFLVDGLLAMTSYSGASSPASAAQARNRGQFDSIALTWSAPVSGGLSLLSLLFVLPDAGYGANARKVDETKAQIEKLGGAK